MRMDEMVQVRRHHGAGIDHGVAHDLRLFAHRRFDPDRRQAEGRILVGVPGSAPLTLPGLMARNMIGDRPRRCRSPHLSA